MRAGGQRHAEVALLLGMTRYLLYRRLDGLQSRSGRVWRILPTLGFESQTAQPVANRYTD